MPRQKGEDPDKTLNLRIKCRAIVPVRWYADGHYHYLTIEEMEKIIDREEAAAAVSSKFGLVPGANGAPIINRVHLYWSEVNEDSHVFVDEAHLPAYCQAGLYSWLRLGASVALWTHNGKLVGLPEDHVTSGQLAVRDASLLLRSEVSSVYILGVTLICIFPLKLFRFIFI